MLGQAIDEPDILRVWIPRAEAKLRFAGWDLELHRGDPAIGGSVDLPPFLSWWLDEDEVAQLHPGFGFGVVIRPLAVAGEVEVDSDVRRLRPVVLTQQI